jgi:hypothetical protein
MKPYGRRLIVHLGFEAVVGEVSRAIRDDHYRSIFTVDRPSTSASGRARHRDPDGYYAFSTLVRSVA